MWRGPAFADVHDEPFAQASIGWLDELRIAAIADRIDADLALRATPISSVSWRLVGQHPLRERLCAQLMLALYGSGRQAEALAVFRDPASADRGSRRRAVEGTTRCSSVRAAPG